MTRALAAFLFAISLSAPAAVVIEPQVGEEISVSAARRVIDRTLSEGKIASDGESFLIAGRGVATIVRRDGTAEYLDDVFPWGDVLDVVWAGDRYAVIDAVAVTFVSRTGALMERRELGGYYFNSGASSNGSVLAIPARPQIANPIGTLLLPVDTARPALFVPFVVGGETWTLHAVEAVGSDFLMVAGGHQAGSGQRELAFRFINEAGVVIAPDPPREPINGIPVVVTAANANAALVVYTDAPGYEATIVRRDGRTASVHFVNSGELFGAVPSGTGFLGFSADEGIITGFRFSGATTLDVTPVFTTEADYRKGGDAATNGTEIALAFSSFEPPDSHVLVRLITATGARVAPDLAAFRRAAKISELDVASSNGAVLAAWREENDLGRTDIHAAALDYTGAAIDLGVISTNGNARSPAIAAGATEFLVAWHDATGIFARRFTLAGELIDVSPISIGPASSSVVGASWDGANYLVAWRSADFGLFAARVAPSGAIIDQPAVVLGPIGPQDVRRMRLIWTGSEHLAIWSAELNDQTAALRGMRIGPGVNFLGSLAVHEPIFVSSAFPFQFASYKGNLLTAYDAAPTPGAREGTIDASLIRRGGLGADNFRILPSTLNVAIGEEPDFVPAVIADDRGWVVIYQVAGTSPQHLTMVRVSPNGDVGTGVVIDAADGPAGEIAGFRNGDRAGIVYTRRGIFARFLRTSQQDDPVPVPERPRRRRAVSR